MRFSINRTCAPQLALSDFIALAQAAHVEAVEIRNDVEGREFADGTPADAVRAALAKAGLKVAAVNALQRFNDWGPQREREARHIIAYAAALGAPGLVLCPVHTQQDWTPSQAQAKLREGLRHLAPILRDHGIKGYVEPLGMPRSTMKRQEMAVAAMMDVDGLDCYALCHDTFQFYRCGDDRLFAEHVGLVHISGVNRTDLAPAEMTEPDRGLIFPDDRVGNVAQLRALLEKGYAGHVSMEPFSPVVQADPQLADRLRASLESVAANAKGA